MNIRIFTFRNDDVRDSLDDSLIKITELFIKRGVPISHAVEPGNVSREVIDWLIKIKTKHPDLIEIIQHGFKHNLNIKARYGGKTRKGEFGPGREYKEQYSEILEGKLLMNEYFDSLWFETFTFPYGGKDDISLRAVNDVGFKVTNDHKGVSKKHKYFYLFGQALKKNFIFDRSVSYHLMHRPNSNLFSIDMNISLITTYYDGLDCKFLSLEELIKKIHLFRNEKTTGIILHHRFHNTQEKIDLVKEMLDWCIKQPEITFATQEKIFNKFSK